MQHGTEQHSVLSDEPLDSCGCLVTSDRDREAVEWLKGQVGPDAVAQAVDRLAGNRRPYPSNVARALGLSLALSTALSASRVMPDQKSSGGDSAAQRSTRGGLPDASKGPPSPEVRRRLQASIDALNASLSAAILAAQDIQRGVQRGLQQ